MPKTAMRMPTVRNSFCQTGCIRLRTLALTTALSNESETSRTPRTITVSITAGPPKPRATPRATTVSPMAQPNVRIMRSFSLRGSGRRSPVGGGEQAAARLQRARGDRADGAAGRGRPQRGGGVPGPGAAELRVGQQDRGEGQVVHRQLLAGARPGQAGGGPGAVDREGLQRAAAARDGPAGDDEVAEVVEEQAGPGAGEPGRDVAVAGEHRVDAGAPSAVRDCPSSANRRLLRPRTVPVSRSVHQTPTASPVPPRVGVRLDQARSSRDQCPRSACGHAGGAGPGGGRRRRRRGRRVRPGGAGPGCRRAAP